MLKVTQMTRRDSKPARLLNISFAALGVPLPMTGWATETTKY